MRAPYSHADVTRMYERALARHSAAPTGDAEEDFARLVRAAAVRAEADDDPPAQTRAGGPRPADGTSDLLDHYERAELLFARMGLAAPTAKALGAAGVEWGALASAFRLMHAEGAEPHLVLAPSLPLAAGPEAADGLSWQKLFSLLTDGDLVDPNPLRARHDGHGLQLGSAIAGAETIAELSRQDLVAATASGRPSVRDELGMVWTVAVVALADSASRGSIPYSAAEGQHLTPSEYLALQAQRLVEGAPPIDRYSWTWLHGTVESVDGEQALAAVWLPGYGQIRIYANPIGYVHERLFARTPVRR